MGTRIAADRPGDRPAMLYSGQPSGAPARYLSSTLHCTRQESKAAFLILHSLRHTSHEVRGL